MKAIESLNVTGEQFCNYLGLPIRRDIMQQLRELQLVQFFKIGKKYMYPRVYIDIVQKLLVNGDIQIRTESPACMRGIIITNKIFKHGKITTKIIFSQEKREKSARPTTTSD